MIGSIKKNAEIVQLWENIAPESSFNGQEVTVDTSPYDMYGIVFAESNTSNKQVFCMAHNGAGVKGVAKNATANTILGRDVSIGDGKLTFENGYSGATASASTMIPMYIYGIGPVRVKQQVSRYDLFDASFSKEMLAETLGSITKSEKYATATCTHNEYENVSLNVPMVSNSYTNFWFEKPIDVTNYTILAVEVAGRGYNNGGVIGLVKAIPATVPTSAAQMTSQFDIAVQPNPSGGVALYTKKYVIIDVSNITGEYYLMFTLAGSASNYAASMTITKIQLRA